MDVTQDPTGAPDAGATAPPPDTAGSGADTAGTAGSSDTATGADTAASSGTGGTTPAPPDRTPEAQAAGAAVAPDPTITAEVGGFTVVIRGFGFPPSTVVRLEVEHAAEGTTGSVNLHTDAEGNLAGQARKADGDHTARIFDAAGGAVPMASVAYTVDAAAS